MEKCLFETILNKYNFFLSDVDIKISKNQGLNRVYFDPEVTVTTQMVPNEYYDMKNEIYRVIAEETKLMPVLRGGWKIHWTCKEKLVQQSQK